MAVIRLLNIPKLLLFTIRYDRPANRPDTQFIPDFFYKLLTPHRQAFRPPVLPERISTF